MGLLSRIGAGFGGGLREMAGDAGRGAMYGTVSGGVLGGLAGPAMGGGESDPMGLNPATGMLGGAALGAMGGAAGGLRHIVIKIAQALKQQHPQVPDEMILQKAMEFAQKQAGQSAGDLMPPSGGGMGGM